MFFRDMLGFGRGKMVVAKVIFYASLLNSKFKVYVISVGIKLGIDNA